MITVYVLYTMFIGDMAPQPLELAKYKTLKECNEEAERLETPYWKYICVKK